MTTKDTDGRWTRRTNETSQGTTIANDKTAVKFSFTSTGVTYTQAPDGNGVAEINFEGTATGFGTVLGTLTLFGDGPGAKTGQSSWVGTAYLENGEEVQGSSEGFYEPSGKHKWRVRGTLRTSTGAMFQSDGVISLDGRTYKGSLTAWN
jgi:hypothetical protein